MITGILHWSLSQGNIWERVPWSGAWHNIAHTGWVETAAAMLAITIIYRQELNALPPGTTLITVHVCVCECVWCVCSITASSSHPLLRAEYSFSMHLSALGCVFRLFLVLNPLDAMINYSWYPYHTTVATWLFPFIDRLCKRLDPATSVCW